MYSCQEAKADQRPISHKAGFAEGHVVKAVNFTWKGRGSREHRALVHRALVIILVGPNSAGFL